MTTQWLARKWICYWGFFTWWLCWLREAEKIFMYNFAFARKDCHHMWRTNILLPWNILQGYNYITVTRLFRINKRIYLYVNLIELPRFWHKVHTGIKDSQFIGGENYVLTFSNRSLHVKPLIAWLSEWFFDSQNEENTLLI